MESADVTPANTWQKMEPIWVTAAKKNLTTLVQYMPGSNVAIGGYLPTYYNKTFEKSFRYKQRIDAVLARIDVDPDQAARPDLIMIHFSLTETSRQYGPYSIETVEQVRKIDLAIGYLINALETRKITQYIDIALMSVTGMGDLTGGVFYLEDIYARGYGNTSSPFLDNDNNHMHIMDLIVIGNRGTVLDIYPRNYDSDHELANEYIDHVYSMIVAGRNDDKYNHFAIYTKDTIPSSYHYKLDSSTFTKDYTPEILIVVDEPYMITTKDKADYGQQGEDGYWSQQKNGTMTGLFVANGPHFRSDGTNGPTLNVLDMHQLMTTVLSIPASYKNKGDMRRASYVLDPYFLESLNGTAPPIRIPSPPSSTTAPTTTTDPHH
jgi:hypothetical protein